MLADYHLVRHKKLKLNDLYTGNSTSIYWFYHGVNWRAPVAFLSGVWPLLRESLFLFFRAVTVLIRRLAFQPDSSAPSITQQTHLLLGGFDCTI